MNNVLSINNISKTYGSVRALQDISFDVPAGSVFGILGPNGSGKTTLLGILLDVLIADTGTYAWLGGIAPEIARRQIGSLLETPNFYPYLSAAENLTIAAAIKQKSTADQDIVLEKLGLAARKNSRFQTFSLGMKQRLALASALIGQPGILILDEPTNGLDPVGIAEIRALIRQLNSQGTTVIMASHMLDEVEKVCSHVAILKKGSLLLHGAVSDILRSEDLIELRASDMASLVKTITLMPGITKVQPEQDIVRVFCEQQVLPEDVNRYCADNGIMLSHLALKRKSLESHFMELTGNREN